MEVTTTRPEAGSVKSGRSGSAPARRRGPRPGAPLHRLVALAALLQACAGGPGRAPSSTPAPAARAAPPSRLVVVPDRGALEIALPTDWTLARVERRPGEEGPAATFLLTPSDGRFRISLSPLDLPPGAPPGLEEARRCAEVARAAATPRAAERAHASFTRAGREVARAWYLRGGTCVRAELSAPRAVGTGGYQMILRSLRFLDGATELEGDRRRE